MPVSKKSITSAVMLAGGSSRRMGKGVDKLMLQAADLPLLVHVMKAFQQCEDVDEIILVVREDRKEEYEGLAKKHKIGKLKNLAIGGVERQDSVWAGLQMVSPECEIVLIHDCARALVTPEIISKCIVAARQTGAAIPASKVKDTIKQAASTLEGISGSRPMFIKTTIDRSDLWVAQTPQTFQFELIRKSYESLIRSRTIVTDDAAAVERMGHPVALVDADPLNFKITTPEDMILAEVVLSKR